MKLVVGLGNPGPDYERTRHNIGFMVVERFAERRRFEPATGRFEGWIREGRVAGEAVAALRPGTFMNRSGTSVAAAVRGLQVEVADVLVVYDDVDFDLGLIRMKRAGGPGGHKGIRSILEELDDDGFSRLRVGIGRPAPSGDVSDWVLEPFREDERDEVEGTIERAADALELWVRRGPTTTMNQINRKAAAPRGAEPAERSNES